MAKRKKKTKRKGGMLSALLSIAGVKRRIKARNPKELRRKISACLSKRNPASSSLFGLKPGKWRSVKAIRKVRHGKGYRIEVKH